MRHARRPHPSWSNQQPVHADRVVSSRAGAFYVCLCTTNIFLPVHPLSATHYPTRPPCDGGSSAAVMSIRTTSAEETRTSFNNRKPRRVKKKCTTLYTGHDYLCTGFTHQANSMSAAFSAIMMVGAAVCPPGIEGMTDESITLSPATPFTCWKSSVGGQRSAFFLSAGAVIWVLRLSRVCQE